MFLSSYGYNSWILYFVAIRNLDEWVRNLSTTVIQRGLFIV